MPSQDDFLFLSREASAQMLARLAFMTLEPKVIADCSSAGNQSNELLKQAYPNAKIIVIESEEEKEESEIIALPDHAVDLIFSNLLLPFCMDFKKIMREWRRILRPEGLLIFSSFGPDTLIELREHNADKIALNLVDMHDIGDALIHARFADPVLDVEYLTVEYKNIQTLTRELQATKMLLPSSSHLQLQSDEHGNFSVTHEIIYGHAWGPSATVDQVADEFGVVRVPLAHLRRR